MGLYQRESLGGPTIGYGIQGWRLQPEIVQHAQNEHCDGRIVNDLHDENEDCGALAGK